MSRLRSVTTGGSRPIGGIRHLEFFNPKPPVERALSHPGSVAATAGRPLRKWSGLWFETVLGADRSPMVRSSAGRSWWASNRSAVLYRR